ncbi:hypothetical protein PR048_016405 [Dryococelus australis]|uniref:HAT C-terminal dimerisation domain-containing protein n=1 Tax=Dryococelus australis TaxID=614101 RepID=A0ABQ9HJM1_9NEOP|nr:hypothetical protein PR048_016405 [Dryococelus australis]
MGRIKEKLHNVEFVGIITNIWTSVSNEDYLSLTIDYMDTNFGLHHCGLEVVPFTEVSQHSTKYLSRQWSQITAGLEMSSFQHIPYLAHALRLVLKDGLLGSRLVTNLLYLCRRLVGRFKHSAHATKFLKKCQVTTGVSLHRLIQEEPTRRNSSLHVLKRLQEQKRAILLVCGELDLPELSGQTLIENLIPIFNLFDSATLQVSSTNYHYGSVPLLIKSCMVSMLQVIPLVQVIEHELENPAVLGSGIQGLKNDLLASMKIKFSSLEEIDIFVFATLLDIRFKITPIKMTQTVENTKAQLVLEATHILLTCDDIKPVSDEAVKDVHVASGYTNIWSCYSNLFKQSSKTNHQDEFVKNDFKIYFSEDHMAPSESIFDYWKSKNECKLLKVLAKKKYLCVPPASVSSERIFSTAGFICDRKRNRLDPERVRMLYFLNKIRRRKSQKIRKPLRDIEAKCRKTSARHTSLNKVGGTSDTCLFEVAAGKVTALISPLPPAHHQTATSWMEIVLEASWTAVPGKEFAGGMPESIDTAALSRVRHGAQAAIVISATHPRAKTCNACVCYHTHEPHHRSSVLLSTIHITCIHSSCEALCAHSLMPYSCIVQLRERVVVSHRITLEDTGTFPQAFQRYTTLKLK